MKVYKTDSRKRVTLLWTVVEAGPSFDGQQSDRPLRSSVCPAKICHTDLFNHTSLKRRPQATRHLVAGHSTETTILVEGTEKIGICQLRSDRAGPRSQLLL